MKIVVYTALFGDHDQLWSVPPDAARGATYVAFTEKPRKEVGRWTGAPGREVILKGDGDLEPSVPTWKQRIVTPAFDSRKSARYYKIMSHEALPDADIVIWVDANIRLRATPEVAAKWVLDYGLAAFKHLDRLCVYQEIAACVNFGKGVKSDLLAQEKAYRAAGMPQKWGLASTRCVVRRHTPEIIELNKAWWNEIQTYSVRDQVGLPFVCWKADLRWKEIPGTERSVNFWFIKHGDKP